MITRFAERSEFSLAWLPEEIRPAYRPRWADLADEVFEAA